MCISIADPHAEYRIAFNDGHYLCMGRDHCLTLSCKKRQYRIPIPQTAQGQLANNERVAKQLIISDDFGQLRVAVSKMINPD